MSSEAKGIFSPATGGEKSHAEHCLYHAAISARETCSPNDDCSNGIQLPAFRYARFVDVVLYRIRIPINAGLTAEN